MEPNRSLLWAIEAIRREERERCAEVAAEVVKAWPASTSAQPELLRLAEAIYLQILQPPAADHDNSQRADADAADEAGETDRLRDAHSG